MGLDTVDLVVKVEKSFGISIPNNEAAASTTVEQLYNTAWRYIQQKQGSYSRVQVENIIDTIIAEISGVELIKITPEKSFTNDLGMD